MLGFDQQPMGRGIELWSKLSLSNIKLCQKQSKWRAALQFHVQMSQRLLGHIRLMLFWNKNKRNNLHIFL